LEYVSEVRPVVGRMRFGSSDGGLPFMLTAACTSRVVSDGRRVSIPEAVRIILRTGPFRVYEFEAILSGFERFQSAISAPAERERGACEWLLHTHVYSAPQGKAAQTRKQDTTTRHAHEMQKTRSMKRTKTRASDGKRRQDTTR